MSSRIASQVGCCLKRSKTSEARQAFLVATGHSTENLWMNAPFDIVGLKRVSVARKNTATDTLRNLQEKCLYGESNLRCLQRSKDTECPSSLNSFKLTNAGQVIRFTPI